MLTVHVVSAHTQSLCIFFALPTANLGEIFQHSQFERFSFDYPELRPIRVQFGQISEDSHHVFLTYQTAVLP